MRSMPPPTRHPRHRARVPCGPLAVATALLALLPASPGTASAQTPDTPPGDTLAAAARDAYLDETARFLVQGVKAARDTAQPGIDAYTALIRERIAVEAPTHRRDRPWVHGERVTRVRWARDEPDVAHVLGARFRDPGVAPDGPPSFFTGLRTERFAADPRMDPFLFGLAALGASEGEAARATVSPLAPESERHYQFRSGDTLSVQLGDGSTIRAIAVTAIPRVRSIRLLSATMLVEPEAMALVRVTYRLAKRVDREVSWRVRQGGKWAPAMSVGITETSSADSARPRNTLLDRAANGLVNALIPQMEMDISTVVADYGLWELRHWLPWRVLWEGHVRVDEDPGPGARPAPPIPTTIDWNIEIEDILELGAEAPPGMPATAAEALERWTQEDDSVSGDVRAADPGEMVTITPADRDALVRSELLPPNLWEERQVGLEADRVAEIASDLAGIGTGEGGDPALEENPWTFHPPGRTLWLVRYNPIEAVSAGTRLRRDFGWGRGTVTVRIPTRRFQAPDANLTLVRDWSARQVQLSAYRELRGGGIDDGGLGASPGTLVTSGDSTDFYWSRGVSLRVLPGRGERFRMSLRFFAESDADLAPADELQSGEEPGSGEGDESRGVRNRFGVSSAWRPWWGGVTSQTLGGGGWAGVRATLGDNPHVRAGFTAALVIPLGGHYSAGVEVGGARVWGDPAPLDLWSLGSSGLWLRGHGDNLLASGIWRARVDLQRPVSFLRLSVFADWASAEGHDYAAVGAGLVFMDGITRLDLAQGLGREGGRLQAALKFHLQGDVLF